MAVSYKTHYISVGANRFSSVSSADPETGIVAFGAGRTVALWDPRDPSGRLTRETLPGHSAQVTVVKHLPSQPNSAVKGKGKGPPISRPIVSGDEEGNVSFWQASTSGTEYDDRFKYDCRWTLKAHEGAISSLGVFVIDEEVEKGLLLTGGNDGNVKVFSWKLEDGRDVAMEEMQTIKLGGRLPLDMAISYLPNSRDLVLAIALTEKKIRLFTSPNQTPSTPPHFTSSLSLEGHEDWVRCLDFSSHPRPTDSSQTDLVLASGSQDGYIRLWNVSSMTQDESAVQSQGESRADSILDDAMLDEFERKITGEAGGSRQINTKAHVLSVKAESGETTALYGVSLEALLIGHEGKLTNVHFSPPGIYGSPRLLSTASDNSMILWAPESQGLNDNTVWLPQQRFGELGAGRSLGMFGALWSIGRQSHGMDVSVVANGWNGGLQRWNRTVQGDVEEEWNSALAPTGHALGVEDLAWDPSGSYLISVSTDQTSRVHAPCQQDSKIVWGELGRPQIHGYDLTCVAFLDRLKFASGADEKVVRVFEAPRGFARSLHGLGVTKDDLTESARAVGASVPPLGLSNRALDQTVDEETIQPEEKGFNQEHISISGEMSALPHEAVLANSTLWPEVEKLYGHGYELMAVAASPDGKLLATSCKATTPEHAVVRVYDTHSWKQISAPLAGHSLTIARIRFSNNSKYILSCSRDRTWRVFSRSDSLQDFTPVAADRTHARIIWDCAWAPDDSYFVTVSRDKQLKTWSATEGINEIWKQVNSIKLKESVTAVDIVRDEIRERDILAVGLEDGSIIVYACTQQGSIITQLAQLEQRDSHVQQVSRLVWRKIEDENSKLELASCSEDRSVRVTRIQL